MHPDSDRSRTNLLDQSEPLQRPFLASAFLHAVVAATALFAGWMSMRSRPTWGDPNAVGGGTVGVTAVKQLPLPASRGPVNPVANDTQSEVPEPPKPAPKETVREEPDAVPIPSRTAPPKRATAPQPAARKAPARPAPETQVYSRSGAAASSPVFGSTPGAAGVGVGTGTPFGTRCGAYANLIRDRVGQKWRTDSVDPRLRTAPPAIVLFELSREGVARNIRVAQSSNSVELDNSARRAILEAGPFPPIPPQCQESNPTVEFWFQLKR